MTDTEGLIPRPADVIGQLDYQINRGGNRAAVNAMTAARDELRKIKESRDFWKDAAHANLDYFNTAEARASRAEAALAEAYEECAKIAEETGNDITADEGLSSLDTGMAIAAAIRARGEK